MQMKLTLNAETNRIIRGISIQDIEDTIVKGIKINKEDSIIATKDNLVVVFVNSDLNKIVKMVSTK